MQPLSLSNSNSLAVPESSIDENRRWNKGTEAQQGLGKGIFFCIEELMNLPFKYLPTQGGKTTSLAFRAVSCISFQTLIPSKPSVLPVWHSVPWLKCCLFKRQNHLIYVFSHESSIPNPMCLRCNLILLYHGDKDTLTTSFCFVSSQSIKASFEQSYLLQDNAIGQRRFEPPWGN